MDARKGEQSGGGDAGQRESKTEGVRTGVVASRSRCNAGDRLFGRRQPPQDGGNGPCCFGGTCPLNAIFASVPGTPPPPLIFVAPPFGGQGTAVESGGTSDGDMQQPLVRPCFTTPRSR